MAKTIAEVPLLSAVTLAEIVSFAKRQVELEELVGDLETSLLDLKAQHRQVSEVDLPAAMKEAKLSEFTLETGEKIKIKEDIALKVPAENRERAYTWLESRGFGGLIKTEVTVSFGRGELEKAQKLVAALIKKKLATELSRDIHWQTLKAFIKERIQAQGKDTPKKDRIPMDLFGAEPLNKAEIKVPKTAK